MTRAAVYNRFWHSMGGGERHSGKIAEVLAADGAQVDLIGHTPVDLPALGAHLGLDPSGLTFRYLPDRGDAAMAAVSAEYDLFVNSSYMSRLEPRSAHAAYLCFFPTPPDHDFPAWRRALVRGAGPLLRGARPAVAFNVGWYPPEGGRRRKWTWTNGEGVLSVAPGGERHLRADLGRPGAPGPTGLKVIDADGATLAAFEVGTAFAPVEVPLPPSTLGTELTLASDAFSPGGDQPGADVRELGVAVSRARVVSASESPRARLALRFPWLLRDPRDLGFLDAYDVVMANSAYTRGWIEKLWKRDAEVLYPPIQVDRLSPESVREPAILAVGRFFAPGLGHAKRQLEMVRWFGRLHRSGGLPAGWRMHVVGGCEDSQLPYLAEVRAAAEGLPVEIHPNAPRPLVEKLLSTCAVFWSATGYGDDERSRPWTAEHFGMTTAEAMAGGCVPVVIDRAGQREIVRHGVDGYRWDTPEQLMALTAHVAADGTLRARLSAGAIARAQTYSDGAFAASWRGIAARHRLLAGRA